MNSDRIKCRSKAMNLILRIQDASYTIKKILLVAHFSIRARQKRRSHPFAQSIWSEKKSFLKIGNCFSILLVLTQFIAASPIRLGFEQSITVLISNSNRLFEKVYTDP